jgi:hypothetical protein
VDVRVLNAAANNARWCDLVCRSHGIPTATQHGLWAAFRRAPEFYPDAVTLLPQLTPVQALRPVQSGRGCTIKDSFATLDLSSHGFGELFEASWIYRDPVSQADRPAWRSASTGEELEAWTRAAGLDEVIRPELLSDPSVRFLADAELQAGAITNETGSVVGVSNVFGDDLERTWRAVARLCPGRPLVGYERDEALKAATQSGFSPIGRLRIWIQNQ